MCCLSVSGRVLLPLLSVRAQRLTSPKTALSGLGCVSVQCATSFVGCVLPFYLKVSMSFEFSNRRKVEKEPVGWAIMWSTETLSLVNRDFVVS